MKNAQDYMEVQRPPKWAGLSVTLLSAIFWYGFIQQVVFNRSFGDTPAPNSLLVFFGLVIPIGFLSIKMVTQVKAEGLYVRISPFHLRSKVFRFEEIDELEVLEYSPIKRFGGWGIRFNLKGETAYTMRGRKAVKLKTRYGTYFIGSRSPETLSQELHQRMLEYKHQ
ncbi:hypothetical protein JOD43_003625 [Pullulanibacillus pueri]|uniref:Uncharacterized protein n=1 Tax=Pullulanibacillus pueri TaxID=1437324 RepID=A0A8J2ZZG5_9BACL|nr:hypothetical protein [Pullulanibacillus pueri]MBM7683445.1 hypothetical protein [Pullulanibacillus pueri]GGH87426.1 hypothetical protein GCM10007096_37420 [Pullulanibacillus pueri]